MYLFERKLKFKSWPRIRNANFQLFYWKYLTTFKKFKFSLILDITCVTKICKHFQPICFTYMKSLIKSHFNPENIHKNITSDFLVMIYDYSHGSRNNISIHPSIALFFFIICFLWEYSSVNFYYIFLVLSTKFFLYKNMCFKLISSH